MDIFTMITEEIKGTAEATIKNDSEMVFAIMWAKAEAVANGESRAGDFMRSIGYTRAFCDAFVGYGSIDGEGTKKRVSEVVTKQVNKKIENTIKSISKKMDGFTITSIKDGISKFTGSIFFDAGFKWTVGTTEGDKVIHFRAIGVSGAFVRPHTRVILTVRKAV